MCEFLFLHYFRMDPPSDCQTEFVQGTNGPVGEYMVGVLTTKQGERFILWLSSGCCSRVPGKGGPQGVSDGFLEPSGAGEVPHCGRFGKMGTNLRRFYHVFKELNNFLTSSHFDVELGIS